MYSEIKNLWKQFEKSKLELTENFTIKDWLLPLILMPIYTLSTFLSVDIFSNTVCKLSSYAGVDTALFKSFYWVIFPISLMLLIKFKIIESIKKLLTFIPIYIVILALILKSCLSVSLYTFSTIIESLFLILLFILMNNHQPSKVNVFKLIIIFVALFALIINLDVIFPSLWNGLFKEFLAMYLNGTLSISFNLFVSFLVFNTCIFKKLYINPKLDFSQMPKCVQKVLSIMR